MRALDIVVTAFAAWVAIVTDHLWVRILIVIPLALFKCYWYWMAMSTIREYRDFVAKVETYLQTGPRHDP